VEIDDAQRRIIRRDFDAEGETNESKHDAPQETEAPVIEKRELVKPEPEKPEQTEQPAGEAEAPQKAAFVDIYAESPEHKKAREDAEAAAAAEAAVQAPAPEAAPEPAAEKAPESAPAPEKKKVDYSRYLDDDDDDFDDDSDTPVRRYSDEDIERLLADTEY